MYFLFRPYETYACIFCFCQLFLTPHRRCDAPHDRQIGFQERYRSLSKVVQKQRLGLLCTLACSAHVSLLSKCDVDSHTNQQLCVCVPSWADVYTPSVKTSPSQRESSVAEPSRLASSDSQSSRVMSSQQQPHDMDCSSSSSSSSRRRIKDEPIPEWTVSGASSRAASASPTKQMKGDSGPAQPQAKLPVVNEFSNQIGQFPVLPPVPMPPPDIGAGIGTSGDAVGPAPPPIQLSDEQRAVLDMVKRGKNVFFTGSAGTGKSVLLREIIKHCRTGRWGRLAITASTGIASVNIGGSTIHSWAGIGLGKESAEKLVGKLLGQMLHWQKKAAMMAQDEDINDNDGETDVDFQFKSKKSPTVDKWREVTTLIIDESTCQQMQFYTIDVQAV